MELFTIQDILNAIPTIFHTLGILKDAFAGAILMNIGNSFMDVIHGNWIIGGLSLIGAMFLLWRLKAWV